MVAWAFPAVVSPSSQDDASYHHRLRWLSSFAIAAEAASPGNTVVSAVADVYQEQELVVETVVVVAGTDVVAVAVVAAVGIAVLVVGGGAAGAHDDDHFRYCNSFCLAECRSQLPMHYRLK